MLISGNMATKINEQINREMYSSYLYLSMAAAFERLGLKIFAQYYYAQSTEENMHAMKMFKYLVDAGGTVSLKSIAEPPAKWETVEEIVTAARDHELLVTKWIHELVAAAEEEKDYSTRSFLQWYVDEQVQEVSAAEELANLVKMAGPHQLLALEYRVQGMIPQAGTGTGSKPA